MRTVALTALAGTSIEWYDFFLYGTAAALVFPTLFFPAGTPPLIGLMASFGTFAVGFIARPVGGILFGHFGDRVGRKKTLVVALMMMGLATTLIGCLPTYAQIGGLAPVLLVSLRFIQGLAIGGQWGGAMLLVTENAPPRRRGYYGAFAQAGAPVGVILANLAFLLVTDSVPNASFLAWGWRLPFLASIALIGVALFVQLRIEDTAAFREVLRVREALDGDATGPGGRGDFRTAAPVDVQRSSSPVIEALRRHPRQIVLAAGSFIAIQVTFYLLITFVIAYGTSPAGLGLPRNMLLTAVLIAAVFMLPALFIAGAISDRYGRRVVHLVGAALLGLWGFAVFPLVDTGSLAWIAVALSVGQVLVGTMYGPQAAFFAELFGTRLRYSGASLGYQLGAIFGGAFAPIIATALYAWTHGTLAISVYIALTCAISLVSVALLTETHTRDLHDPVTPLG